jgi:hypothetical protein
MPYSCYMVLLSSHRFLTCGLSKYLQQLCSYSLLLRCKFLCPKLQDPEHVPSCSPRVMIKGVPPPHCYDNNPLNSALLFFSTHYPSLHFHTTSMFFSTRGKKDFYGLL